MIVFVNKNNDFEMFCKKAFDEKFKNSNELYKSRLEYEISAIKESGYDGLILALRDFVKSINGQIAFISKANASFVAYTLGITQINPFDYDLVFELFVNKERMGIADLYAKVSDSAFNECVKYTKNHALKNIDESTKSKICEICYENDDFEAIVNDENGILFYENDEIFIKLNLEKSTELNIIEGAKNDDLTHFENSSLYEKMDIKKIFEPKCFDDIIALVGLNYIDYKIAPQIEILKH